MTTLEEAFEQFKQLPDWDKYPMPDVFYSHFNLPKPKPSSGSVMDMLTYSPPPSLSLNKRGKVEVKGPLEGGVREVQFAEAPPVEVNMLTDETDDDTKQDSDQTMTSPPIEDTSSEILPGWDQQSLNPFYAAPGNAPSVPCHDAECNPASQQPQSAWSESFPYLLQK